MINSIHRSSAVLSCIMLCACGTLPNPAWHSAPPMQYARAAHAVVATPDAIYALAGTGQGGLPVLPVERFDGTRWQTDGNLPGAGLNAPAAAVLDGKIYLIGGFNTSTNIPSAEVAVYDPATRNWQAGVPLPAPRGGHAAAVLQGRIHVVGGGNSERTLSEHSVFDPASGQWQARAALPRAEGSPALVALDGKLYAIGGRSGDADFGDVYIYDPQADRWHNGPPIPPRGTAGGLVVCDRIWIFGGESQAKQASLADVLQLDLAAQRWLEAAPLPTARNFARAVKLGQTVYVVGGSPTAGDSHESAGSAVVERFLAPCATP